jgi:Protein of unknown function (DUF2817)
MNAAQHFSSSYALQRRRFHAAANDAGLTLESHTHPLAGREGEKLAMDVARLGARHAQRVLIIASGTHGLEGFCGSGAQLSMLADPTFHRHAQQAGVAVLYVHGVNPWGFSWLHRWTHENVDLNRNCIDFSAPASLPVNHRYAEIAELLVPAEWPAPEADSKLMVWMGLHGYAAMQQAVQGGQYTHPNGLFYGGTQPAWSNLTFRKVVREHAATCTHLAMIDLHSGLGPSGQGERIVAAPDDSASRARARAWWKTVTSLEEGNSVSAKVSGSLCSVLQEESPRAQVTSIALEYGTEPPIAVLTALRADQWLSNQRNPDPRQQDAIRQQVLAAFYTDTDLWKQQVVDQALEAVIQAVDGLASE